MQQQAEPSYLRVTAWAFTVLVGAMLLAALLGGFDAGAVTAR